MSSLGNKGGWPCISQLEETPLHKVFVWVPKRLYRGGWTWGHTYMRRPVKQTTTPAGPGSSTFYINRWLLPVEYYTDEEAAVLKLKGET